eukprot:84718-Prorocentrum_minimum.AAC.1
MGVTNAKAQAAMRNNVRRPVFPFVKFQEGAVWAVGRGQTCEQVLGKLKVTEGACRGCVVVAAFVKIVLLA